MEMLLITLRLFLPRAFLFVLFLTDHEGINYIWMGEPMSTLMQKRYGIKPAQCQQLHFSLLFFINCLIKFLGLVVLFSVT